MEVLKAFIPTIPFLKKIGHERVAFPSIPFPYRLLPLYHARIKM